MPAHRTGPVRSEEARRSILAATARLFAERGYDHLTIEGIAAEAHVGKQTIYRWWGNKGAVVAECVLEGRLFPDRLIPTGTGELRADLIAWVDRVLDLVETAQGQVLMRSLIAAAAENVEIGERLGAVLGGATTLRLNAAAAEALVGALIVRALARRPRTPGDAAEIVDTLLGAH